MHVDRRRLWLYVWVAVVAFSVFLPWWQGYFLGDDWMLLARNSGRALPPLLRSISDASNSSGYRPLTELSLAWSWLLFDLNPAGHHILNLALYALNAVLVAALGRRLAGDWRVGLWAGIVFAVLGCHTEPVVWMTARHEILAALCALFSLSAYIRFRDTGRRAWWVGALLFYILSLGFKETTLLLPLFLIAYDWLFVFPPRRGSVTLGQWLPWLPIAALGVAYVLFRLWVGGGYNVPFSALALPKNFVYYLLMEVVALPASTSFLSRFPWVTLPVIVSLAAVCLTMMWLARERLMRHRLFRFGAVWMAVALAPVILIVAERAAYFSSIGWAWVMSVVIVLAWETAARLRFAARRVVVLAVAIMLGANLVTQVHRAGSWNRASDISRDVFAQVQETLRRLSPGQSIHVWFFGFPDQIEYADVFGDRILFAAWLLEDQLGVEADVHTAVFRNMPISLPPAEHMQQMQVEQAVTEPVVAFYWQGDAFLRLSTPEGVVSP